MGEDEGNEAWRKGEEERAPTSRWVGRWAMLGGTAKFISCPSWRHLRGYQPELWRDGGFPLRAGCSWVQLWMNTALTRAILSEYLDDIKPNAHICLSPPWLFHLGAAPETPRTL